MEIYQSRMDKKFQDRLTEVLSISGEDGLRQCAIETDNPIRTGEETEYTHCITLDYIGGSASEFLDRPGSLLQRCCFSELEKLIKSTNSLNDQGYFIKIRMLLLYPYSAAGQIRIQAEDSHMRSAVNNPATEQNLREITPATIQRSNFLRRVERNMSILHELEEDLGEGHSIHDYPNMLEVRFSPVNPMTWCIRVNNVLFYQPYIYGKEDRYDGSTAAQELPVVELDQDEGLSYDVLIDHFRYNWEYDATIVDEDCVEYDISGAQVKPPNLVTFSEKALSLTGDQTGDLDENTKRKAEELQARLDPHCPDLVSPPDEEVAFISTSWNDDSSRSSEPHQDAQIIVDLITEFFRERQGVNKVPNITPKIVDTPPGNRFPEDVYAGLENATMGIIILTPEIASGDIPRPISSPNVYHELGYLMARLENNRIYIFTAPEVEPPSNLRGMVHIPYQDMYHGFIDLIVSFNENDIISESELKTVSDAYDEALKDLEGVNDQTRGKVQTYINERIE